MGLLLWLRSRGWVFSCGCVAVGASRPALRKGLDRRTGPGSGGLSERDPGGRKILRSCVRGRRMLRSLRDPVTNAASLGLPHAKAESCVRRGLSPAGRRRFFLCAGRSTRRENPCPYGPLFVATMLPSRGTVHAKEASWPRPADPAERRPPAPVEAFRRPRPLEATATEPHASTQLHPADPTESGPTAPVEALSETDPPGSHSDAAAGRRPEATRRPQDATSCARVYARGCANRYAARSRSVLTWV